MNTGIANGTIKGWQAYKQVKRFNKYGHQRGWERKPPENADCVNSNVNGFTEIPLSDMDLPFE